jgi:hypothetical protein
VVAAETAVAVPLYLAVPYLQETRGYGRISSGPPSPLFL